MIYPRALARGARAALFICALALVNVVAGIYSRVPACASAALAPNERVLPDGLSTIVRRATASPTVALEVWIKAPSAGYAAPRPGISRLAALALVSRKEKGVSLIDAARADGGRASVSIFPTSTEFVVTAPSYAAADLLRLLVERVLRPNIDAAALTDGKKRFAEQQSAAATTPDVMLRDALFNTLFSGGPYHESTYGTAESVRSVTLAEVKAFIARAYVPANAMVVAVGDLNQADIERRITVTAPRSGATQTIPASTRAAAAGAVRLIVGAPGSSTGVGLGWFGPPIADERASTAMDFLSDYLTRPGYGLVAKAVGEAGSDYSFVGQFVTLENPGVFYLSAAGTHADAQGLSAIMRNAYQRVTSAPLSAADFARALTSFKTHMLRDVQTPQSLADNYGWYFVQGAPAYTPSAVDENLGGDYFSRVDSLTSEYVFEIAKMYLGAAPVSVTLTARRSPATGAGLPDSSRKRDG